MSKEIHLNFGPGIALREGTRKEILMLILSLVFSLVILVSFNEISTGLIAGSSWALFSYILFNTPAF